MAGVRGEYATPAERLRDRIEFASGAHAQGSCKPNYRYW